MNKQQVIEKLKLRLADQGVIYPKWELNRVINTFLNVVIESLDQDNNVNLTNFGRFMVKTKKSRRFYNIQKGATEQTQEKRVIEFSLRKARESSNKI